ncbi:MAG: hypothetical protein HRT87_04490 [Legionellales bacterium]|nr:hypothetical protein [Legionellales bacterium]
MFKKFIFALVFVLCTFVSYAQTIVTCTGEHVNNGNIYNISLMHTEDNAFFKVVDSEGKELHNEITFFNVNGGRITTQDVEIAAVDLKEMGFDYCFINDNTGDVTFSKNKAILRDYQQKEGQIHLMVFDEYDSKLETVTNTYMVEVKILICTTEEE